MNTRSRPSRALRGLTEAALQELALRYVGKYATTRAKLKNYLARKLRERGWEGAKEPELDALANRFAELGYIDDAAYALGRAQALSARGYGKRRVADTLRFAGIEAKDGAAAVEHADMEATRSALRYAKRRHLGPFASLEADARLREKWVAAMVRAGHGFALSRATASLAPGANVDDEALQDQTRIVDA